MRRARRPDVPRRPDELPPPRDWPRYRGWKSSGWRRRAWPQSTTGPTRRASVLSPTPVPLHTASGRCFGPAAARGRTAQHGPGTRETRAGRRGHGAGCQRHLFVIDGYIVCARQQSYASTAAEDLLWPGARALHVDECDLAIGERGAGEELVAAVGSLRFELKGSGERARDIAGRLGTPGEFTRCAYGAGGP